MTTLLTVETFESLLIAVALGAIVGIEREHAHRPAGLRTHMIVSLGSCLFTIMSSSFGSQPAQVAGGIVSQHINACARKARKRRERLAVEAAQNTVERARP